MKLQDMESTVENELPVWPECVSGGKYVAQLQKHLNALRDESPHGNQELFLDDVFIVHLLAFFNSSIRSLRTFEDFSQTRQAQKHLSIRKLCKSTLSDFHSLVDPERLRPILDALRKKVEAKKQRDKGNVKQGDELSQLLSNTVAVDGTFLPALAEVAWAVRSANQTRSEKHRARIDAQINVQSWLPEAIVVPEPKQGESNSAANLVQPGKLYLYDRGFSAYALINAHYETNDDGPQAKADFVIRYRAAGGNSPTLQNAVENELTQEELDASVVSDRTGKFRSSHNSRHQILDVQLREVIVQYVRESETKTVRLITNLLDVSAATIAKLYCHRWQVELFFRWLKCYGNFNHLISHNAQGVQLNFHVTIIAVMLMYLHTGFRPSKYLFSLMSQVAGGGASFEEIMPILRERERRCELARNSQRKRLAKKK